jgi:hypothetical protein
MNRPEMPDWLRDVVIALGSFFGGRAANVLGAQINEGREMRRGLDRLTTAVESIGSDLRDIRGEIHSQVAGLKVDLHEQIAGVRQELHSTKLESEVRLRTIEDRVDSTNGRIDALSSASGLLTGTGRRPSQTEHGTHEQP